MTLPEYTKFIFQLRKILDIVKNEPRGTGLINWENVGYAVTGLIHETLGPMALPSIGQKMGTPDGFFYKIQRLDPSIDYDDLFDKVVEFSEELIKHDYVKNLALLGC